MDVYDWVSEGSIRKYNRALIALKEEGKEATEEAIKALYIIYGGLVRGDASTVQGNDDPEQAAASVPPMPNAVSSRKRVKNNE